MALAALATLAGAAGHGWALDDLPLVRDDPRIRDAGSIPSLLLQPYWPVEGAALYRPVATISFALNRALTGESPAGFHVASLLLHAVASVLAWFAARRAGTLYGTALAAGLLFAVHPLHVEPAVNVAARAELLAAVGVLGAWLLHRRGKATLAALAFLAAVLSKESAILAPLLFAADDRLGGERWVRRTYVSYLPYAGAVLLALTLRVSVLGGLATPATTVFLDNPAAFAAPFTRIATGLWVHAKALGLAAWPATLCADYSYDAIPVVSTAGDPRFWAGLLVALGLAGAAWWSWAARKRTVFLAIALWVLFFLPASNLLFPSGTLFAERLLYLPLLGPCLLAGHAVASLAERRPALAKISAAVTLLLVAALAARSVARVPAWKDNATLALADVRTSPRSAKLQMGAGLAYGEREPGKAEGHFRKAVEIWPDYAQAHYNLAVLLEDRGARRESFTHVRKALALSDNPRARELALRLLREGALDALAAAGADYRCYQPEEVLAPQPALHLRPLPCAGPGAAPLAWDGAELRRVQDPADSR